METPNKAHHVTLAVLYHQGLGTWYHAWLYNGHVKMHYKNVSSSWELATVMHAWYLYLASQPHGLVSKSSHYGPTPFFLFCHNGLTVHACDFPWLGLMWPM